MSDQPRFLGRALGYTSSPLGPDALEAVPDGEQQHQTEQAHQKALDQRIASRQATRAEVERELAFHESRCRYLQRELRRLGRAVT